MPRHRQSQQATHLLTAERTTTTGGGGYGDEPTSTTETVVTDSPVEYDDGGTTFVRQSTGERVQRAPRVLGRGALAESLEEGDTVTLDPLDPDTAPIESLEVRGVSRNYHGHARAGQVAVELEQQ